MAPFWSSTPPPAPAALRLPVTSALAAASGVFLIRLSLLVIKARQVGRLGGDGWDAGGGRGGERGKRDKNRTERKQNSPPLSQANSVPHGDGGGKVPLLARRIRAHGNFVEYTPLVLILLGLLEATTTKIPTAALAAVATVYAVARGLHAHNMTEIGRPFWARRAGTMWTGQVILVLSAANALAAAGVL